VHSSRTLFEYNSMIVANNLKIGWTERRLDIEAATFCGQDLRSAYDNFVAARDRRERPYVDCHAWTFTPLNLALLLNEAHALGLVSVVPESVSQSENAEFFVHLELAARRPINHHERMQMLALVAKEQAAGFRAVRPTRRLSIRNLAYRLREGLTQ
jgi:hypothetical protein